MQEEKDHIQQDRSPSEDHPNDKVERPEQQEDSTPDSGDADEAGKNGSVSDDNIQDRLPEAGERRSGCLAGCLIPMVVIIAVLLLLFTLGYSRRTAIQKMLMTRIVTNTEAHVLDQLPEDMDAKEVETTFERLKAAIREDRVEKEVLTDAIAEYQRATRNELSDRENRQILARLMKALSAAMGQEPQP